MLREDTIGRIVYGLRLSVYPENCFYAEDTLFDFSITQYGTIEPCNAFMAPVSFDTVFYDNAFGYIRKHYFMGGIDYWGNSFIEGIGSTYGLFEEMGVTSKDVNTHVLRCYTIGDIYNCDILTQNKERFVADIKMYPNPLLGENLYISLPGGNGQNVKAIISDVYGKPLYECILDEGSNKIGLGGLNKGLYFIKILNENKLLLNKKIMLLISVQICNKIQRGQNVLSIFQNCISY